MPNHCVSRHFWGVRGLRVEPFVLSSEIGVANSPCFLDAFRVFSNLLGLNGPISRVRTRPRKRYAFVRMKNSDKNDFPNVFFENVHFMWVWRDIARQNKAFLKSGSTKQVFF